MAQLDFYADTSDIIEVIDYMFSLSPMKLFEAYSSIDSELLEFKSGKDILESSHIQNNKGNIFVRGWWKSVTNAPIAKQFTSKPPVGNFRYSLEGVATFQLLQGKPNDLCEKALNPSCFSHWNEKGALERAHFSENDILEVDWQELRSLSGKLNRNIRNKMSVAKLFKRPILAGAYSSLESGAKLFGQLGVYARGAVEIES